MEQARHDHGTSSNANCIPIGYDFEPPKNKKIIYPNELGLGMDRLAIKISKIYHVDSEKDYWKTRYATFANASRKLKAC